MARLTPGPPNPRDTLYVLPPHGFVVGSRHMGGGIQRHLHLSLHGEHKSGAALADPEGPLQSTAVPGALSIDLTIAAAEPPCAAEDRKGPLAGECPEGPLGLDRWARGLLSLRALERQHQLYLQSNAMVCPMQLLVQLR